MVDQLAVELQDQPVVFLEHDVDNPLGNRFDRWWAAYGAGSVTLPLTMVDSGEQISNGSVSFASTYRAMVETAQQRPPAAKLVVDRRRSGSSFHFEIELTNRCDETLRAGNDARLHVIVYEDIHLADTNRFVRAVRSITVGTLAPDASKSFTVEVPLTGVNWSKLHSVVLVDYRPSSGNGSYDMLQAAIAMPAGLGVVPSQLALSPGEPSAEVELRGPHVLSWSAAVDVPWLEVVPEQGQVPGSAEVRLRPDKMTGDETAEVHFEAVGDGMASNLDLVVTSAGIPRPAPRRIPLRVAPTG